MCFFYSSPVHREYSSPVLALQGGEFHFPLCFAQSQEVFPWCCWPLKPTSFCFWTCYCPLHSPSRIIRLMFIVWFVVSYLLGFWMSFISLHPYASNAYLKICYYVFYSLLFCFLLVGHDAKNGSSLHLLSLLKNGQTEKFIWRPTLTT